MKKQWTFLIYLAGDNNLEAFGRGNLAEMKAVGSTDDLNIVAQFDQMGDSGTRRYYLRRGSSLEEDEVGELPETNTGDPKALLDFVRWGLTEFPAAHVALILWNHGAGWKDDDIYASARRVPLSKSDLPKSLVRGVQRRPLGHALFRTSFEAVLGSPANDRAILFDDTSQDFLDNQELKHVLDQVLCDRQGQRLDLIGFDACLMSMIEVAAQVGPSCAYMVGSQELEPGEGWPYARILNTLAAQPEAPPQTLAHIIVESFGEFYRDYPVDMAVTQSALQLQRLPELVQAVGILSDYLLNRLRDDQFYVRALLPVMRHVQHFRDRDYVDLLHFVQLLKQHGADDAFGVILAAISTLLEPTSPTAVIVARRSQGRAVPYAQGLSIYFPQLNAVSPAYAALEFTQHCDWGKFLAAFLQT